MVRKQHLENGIYKIVSSIVKLSVFSNFLEKKLNFRTLHISCVFYYDDIMNRDVT